MTTTAAAIAPKTPPMDEPAAQRPASPDGVFASLVGGETAATDSETVETGQIAAPARRKVETDGAAAAAVAALALVPPTPLAPVAPAAPEGSADGAEGGAPIIPAAPAVPAAKVAVVSPDAALSATRDPVAAGVASLVAAAEQATKKNGAASSKTNAAADALDGVTSIKAETQADDAPATTAPAPAAKTEPTGAPQQTQASKLDAPAPLAPPSPAAAGQTMATASGEKTSAKAETKIETKAGAKSDADQKAPAVKPGDQKDAQADAQGADKPVPAADPTSARDAAQAPDRSAAPGQPAQAQGPSATTSAQTQPTSALASAAAAQVATEIASNAGSRKTRFEVRLDPGELGRVDVRLDIGHDGRVSTRLIVEKAETLDMLKQDARELTRQLEQAGFQLGQGGLAFQLKDGRQDLWRQYEPEVRAAKTAPEEIEEAAPAAAPYARAPRSGASGVDRTV